MNASANAPAANASGRDDYDQLVSFKGLEPGEPFMLIRARDIASGDAARAYAAIAKQKGAPIATVELALRQADKLDAWPKKKVPDVGGLTEAEQKNLAYAFARRAWNARADCADVRVMLAEERGLNAALARLRTILGLLFTRGRVRPSGRFVYDPKAKSADGHQIDGPDAIAALRNLATALREPA